MIEEFIASVIKTYKTTRATEHSYRPALLKLFNSLDTAVTALNEPKREKVGAPDFSFSRDEVVIGHCEAKDVDINLDDLNEFNAGQQKRYVEGLQNLVYTNCFVWRWYRDGELQHEVRVAEFDKQKITPLPDSYPALEALLREFIAQAPQTITSSRALAERMAGKAALIKELLANSLNDDAEGSSELSGQYSAFKTHLIHDISVRDFADIYAETITYGMFAARLHDDSPNDFDRKEALELLPKSNPFLRNLFGYIAGPNLDSRIAWIIDDLARLFRASDVLALMEAYGKTTQRNDPFLHFYEDFLKAYNSEKRKARGVWYTPEPVVNFIVRAVDHVLKSDFTLDSGIADTSKVLIDWDTGQLATTKEGKIAKSKSNATIKKEVHRVQILDPATGTGTFLAEVIKQVAGKISAAAPSGWATYVETDLIPRLHGFELLMASYAMCHMKLDMVLREYGYKPTNTPPRVSVYLTNSLEEGEIANQTLPFAQWLSHESKQANAIKRDMPIMVVIGNPPYSIRSSNLSSYQVGLVARYRNVDGAPIKEKGALQFEKNINNDYVKFIALAEQLILRNKTGVLGFITSHGFLSSPTYRGMRQQLLSTFDKCYVIDLHGNSDIKEDAPGGISDENVFDIKQGVSILIGVRGGVRSAEKSVHFAELWGSRNSKYERLFEESLDTIKWVDLSPRSPQYDFRPKDIGLENEYLLGFSITELMPVYSSGIITSRDDFSTDFDRSKLAERMRDFVNSSEKTESDLRKKFSLRAKAGWDALEARSTLRKRQSENGGLDQLIHPISYRPFDTRYVLFDDSVVWTTAHVTMDSMVAGDNVCLVTARSEKSGTCSHFLVSDGLVETKFAERTTQSAVFPLYLSSDSRGLLNERRPNLSNEVLVKFSKVLGFKPKPLELFDYVYACLHSPRYRTKYRQFLRSDFPRVPYPSDMEAFKRLSNAGAMLRHLHLMKSDAIGSTPFPFVGDEKIGKSKVGRAEFRDGSVWINGHQKFDNVTETAWTFFVGGYQPAQKWLKDRQDRVLTFSDIQHYQRILKVLSETARIMVEIDE